MPKKPIELAAMLVLLLGCGHESAATQQVRSAAAIDLDCEESMIEFVDDEPMRKRVSGCGRTLTYMNKCNHIRPLMEETRINTNRHESLRLEPEWVAKPAESYSR